MSLETAIADNTAAIRDLIARLTAGALPTMTAAEYIAKIDAPVAKTQVEEKKPAATPTVPETKAVTNVPAAESPSEQAKTGDEQAAIDYAKDVKPLLLKVSTSKGRDALVALLAKFGVTKGDKLPADELGNVIAEIETLLAA